MMRCALGTSLDVKPSASMSPGQPKRAGKLMIDSAVPAPDTLRMAIQTLFEKYGGYETVSKLVSAFYEKILADDELVNYFENVDMERLMTHQTNFIGMVLGGPANQYTGRELKSAHQALKITSHHFDLVANHLRATLLECGVESQDIETILGTVRSARNEIVSQ